jgi:hypothetical protein
MFLGFDIFMFLIFVFGLLFLVFGLSSSYHISFILPIYNFNIKGLQNYFFYYILIPLVTELPLFSCLFNH